MSYCAHCGTQVTSPGAFCQTCGKPHSGVPPVVIVKTGSKTALIVALFIGAIVMAIPIVGILAAIAIPNLLTAIDRSKQKRTMADLRTIGTAVESYATDFNAYPRAADFESLRGILVPKYAPSLATMDAWDGKIYYGCWRDHPSTLPPEAASAEVCRNFRLTSGGKDRVLEHDPLEPYAEGVTRNFNCDIVYENGRFVQYPDGSRP